jgi:hypothetical protein
VQKILIMSVYGTSLRSEAFGWTIEGGDIAEKDMTRYLDSHPEARGQSNNVPVGMIGVPRDFSAYTTPLHALGNGWRLMNAPRPFKLAETDRNTYYEWWFEK